MGLLISKTPLSQYPIGKEEDADRIGISMPTPHLPERENTTYSQKVSIKIGERPDKSIPRGWIHFFLTRVMGFLYESDCIVRPDRTEQSIDALDPVEGPMISSRQARNLEVSDTISNRKTGAVT